MDDTLEAYVAALVAAAPPLTADQVARLRLLLSPDSTAPTTLAAEDAAGRVACSYGLSGP